MNTTRFGIASKPIRANHPSVIISIREVEVLNLIALEYTINMIAAKLFISHHTVISHRKNLMRKLDAKNTAGLIRKAFEYGLFIIDDR